MTASKDINFTLKLMLLGETEVGKSCFINRFTNNSFDNNHMTTIGVDFQNKETVINGRKVKLQIWDTAGQESFKSLTKNYFRKSHGFILAYDITNRKSFDSINEWIGQIREFRDCENDIVLVATKCDLEDDRIVTKEEGEQLAKENSLKLFETSAKDKKNVTEAFHYLTEQILNSIERGEIPERTSIVLNKDDKKSLEKKCC